MSETPQNHISVRLTSSGLPDSAVQRIDNALQRALLIELAELAIGPADSIQVTKANKPGGGKLDDLGGTKGMYIEFPKDVKFGT